jgi:hypothetical protein
MEEVLHQRGFRFQHVTDMDGWLAYRAAFVACVAAALGRCGTDPTRLAADARPSPCFPRARRRGQDLPGPGPLAGGQHVGHLDGGIRVGTLVAGARWSRTAVTWCSRGLRILWPAPICLTVGE